LGGPHGLDHASLTYAGNTAEQGGYLAAGGLGGLAGIGPYGAGYFLFIFLFFSRFDTVNNLNLTASLRNGKR